MKLFDVYSLLPMEPVSASGCRIYDGDQTKYLDLYGGHAVISVGHNHPVYREALIRQLEKISFYSNLPLPEIPTREDQLRALLAQVFKIAKERGMKGEVPEIPEPKMEPEEAAAISALEQGDYSGAAMAYRNWLQRQPNEPMAKLGLAQCELALRISTLDFERTIKSADEKPDSLQDQLMAADVEVATGRHKSGFDRLLRAVQRMSGDDKNKAKEHLLLLFQLVDPSDPDVI
ncbi:MAG: tetratricopeptide repeat protein, partial [Bacteroidota bacterium]